jgi:hypothetical protein
MHAPPAAVRATGGAPEQFSHQLPGSHSLGQSVPVPAVRAEDNVALPEMGAHSDGYRLFADVCMTRSMDEPALMRFRQLLFALADDLHVVEEVEERLFAEAGGGDC